MLEIGRTLISLDVIEKQFCCDLKKCKGICCIEGDSGAPLDEKELAILDDIYPVIEKYLTPKGIKAIKEQGKYLIDTDGDYVTPLINNQECAYTIFENGIAFCAIERAYFDKKIDFRKPVSCHLYPIRITQYIKMDAVNYDKQPFCKDARTCGKQKKTAVYQFLKEPLIRKYGKKWYEQLKIAAQELAQSNKQ